MSDNSFDIRTGLVPTGPRDLATGSASLARRGLTALEAQGVRIVRFPADWSLGTVYVLDPGDPHGKWEALGDPPGTVVVPMGKALGLPVRDEASDADMSALATLQPGDLFGLFLASPEITDAGLVHVSGLTGLRELTVLGESGMRVTDSGVAHLSGLTALRKLTLDDQEVSDAGLALLSGLTALRDLAVPRTLVTDVGLARLSGLRALERLDLECVWTWPSGDSGVTNEGLAHLSGLRTLQELNLTGAGITDAGLAHLSGLTALRELNLGLTAVTWEGAASLTEALPNCRIRWAYGDAR